LVTGFSRYLLMRLRLTGEYRAACRIDMELQREKGVDTISNEVDAENVVEMVNQLVEKYNSLLRINQLLMEFLQEKQLQEEFLGYLVQHDPLPDKQ